jgi:hypothetical protein
MMGDPPSFADHPMCHGSPRPPSATLVEGVFRREADGTVTTVVGGYVLQAAYRAQHGRLARGAALAGSIGLAVDARGVIYVSQAYGTDNCGMFRVASELTGEAEGEIRIPSPDATEEYFFTPGGRHLRTVDALTRGARHCSRSG